MGQRAEQTDMREIDGCYGRSDAVGRGSDAYSNNQRLITAP